MIYNTKFFYYDINGYITRISNVKEDTTDSYVEIEDKFLEDFFNKPITDITKYNIKYFEKLVNGENVEKEISNKFNSFIILPKTNAYNNDVTLEHRKNYWRLHIKDDVKIDPNKNLYFYITLKNNINFYLATLCFNVNSRLHINFTTVEEENLYLLNVITTPIVKSYGIKELQ